MTTTNRAGSIYKAHSELQNRNSTVLQSKPIEINSDRGNQTRIIVLMIDWILLLEYFIIRYSAVQRRTVFSKVKWIFGPLKKASCAYSCCILSFTAMKNPRFLLNSSTMGCYATIGNLKFFQPREASNDMIISTWTKMCTIQILKAEFNENEN